jgi:nucleotide-binding universal stress UspA family protein
MKDIADPNATVAVKRILVPIDKSEYKEKIASYALSLTKALGAEMTVIHVIEPGPALPDGVETQVKDHTRLDESRRQAEDLLNRIDIQHI